MQPHVFSPQGSQIRLQSRRVNTGLIIQKRLRRTHRPVFQTHPIRSCQSCSNRGATWAVTIFQQKTGFITLDRLLTRLNANKTELLRVLERPETPLNTNQSENDIRAHVTRREISGTTRSDKGRDCRDAFLGLAKTCRKLGISFWNYLGSRFGITTEKIVPPLPELIAARNSS